MKVEKKYILRQAAIENKMKRLALEIIENNLDEKELIFVGVAPTGIIVAKELQHLVQRTAKVKIELLTMEMDKNRPGPIELSAAMNFDDKIIILIDDVTNSGRTLLYAMKPFLERHPKKIQTLVLVERSHTQFPIHANYKGFTLATTLQEHIKVEVEADRITGAYLS